MLMFLLRLQIYHFYLVVCNNRNTKILLCKKSWQNIPAEIPLLWRRGENLKDFLPGWFTKKDNR
jgi:hypothetical protein